MVKQMKLKEFLENNAIEETINKNEILNSIDLDLSKGRYFKTNRNKNITFKKLGEVCDVFNGSTPSRKEQTFWENG